MPKLDGHSLAGQLAKAAGQAVSHDKAGVSKASDSAVSGWVVPQLGIFKLDDALGKAYTHAEGYLNFMLASEGLVVDVQQGDGQTMATVAEQGGTRTYRQYAGPDMLKLYASQRGGRGVVADGQV